MVAGSWGPPEERWFTTLVEAMADVVVVVDAGGVIRYANPAAHRLVGRTLAEHPGLALHDLVHPEDQDRLRPRIGGADDGADPDELVEVRLRAGDGKWAHVEIATANRLADPRLGAVVLVLRKLPTRRIDLTVGGDEQPSVTGSADVRAELERGLRTEDVEVHYQPVVDTATGATVGLEALARWRHPSFGLLPAADFLALAEEMGMVSALDWCVLERVAADRQQWRTECPKLVDLPMAVNISVNEVSPDLERRVEAFLASPGGQGGRLSLELSEQVLHEATAVSAALERLKDRGIGLTVDGSGGGYSALPHLPRLPIRRIKLDPTFLATVAVSNPEFTSTFVELYSALDVQVVAVGVESFEQHQVVRSVGIHWAQGFFYGEPMAPADLMARLNAPSTLPTRRRRSGPETVVDARPPGAGAEAVRAELERGFRTEDVEVHYQPVVDTATGGPVGLEALARWRHPTFGLLRPGEFLGVAEEMGVVSALDGCVLERVASDREQWQTECPRLVGLPVAVNISVNEISPDLERRVEAFLASPGGAGARLSLELSEEVLLREASAVAATFERLQQQGIGLTVDGSGGGYSALPHLPRLPIRLLKLDRSFLATVAVSNPEFTSTFVELYAALGVQVVAVGVESFEQHQVVRSVGIRWAQGFFYAEPMPPADLVARFTAKPTPAPDPAGP